MRAREFTINIPITIKLDSLDDPQTPVVQTMAVPVAPKDAVKNQTTTKSADDIEGSSFVPPLQQKLELMKAAAGKNSKVIQQLVADEDEPFEG